MFYHTSHNLQYRLPLIHTFKLITEVVKRLLHYVQDKSSYRLCCKHSTNDWTFSKKHAAMYFTS